MYSRLRTTAALLAVAALASCSANSVSPGPLLNLVRLPVPSAQGGSLSLPNGDSIVVPPGALAANENVVLSANLSETPTIPVPGWAAASGTMTVQFSSALSASPGSTESVTLRFAYAAGMADKILAAQAPLLEITSPGGTVERISPDGTFDTTKGTLTVTVPAAQLAGATKLKLYAAIDGSGIPGVSFGPRYWDETRSPAAWIPEPFTIDPTKRTIVMVHGIFSSVETAFPCEQELLDKGGYAQGVGLDYDWTQPPATEGLILASFINSLPVSTVDIEAHSYGTVVSLAALPLITKKIAHVVLLGGPLPLNGAPQADPGYLRDLVMLGVWLAYPSDVYRAEHSGMISALATNSSAMRSINTGVRSLTALPPFIQVAGEHPLPQEVDSIVVHALYLTLYGFSKNDGVVEEKSATTSFPTTKTLIALDDDHIQLECQDQGIIDWVGMQVHP